MKPAEILINKRVNWSKSPTAHNWLTEKGRAKYIIKFFDHCLGRIEINKSEKCFVIFCEFNWRPLK